MLMMGFVFKVKWFDMGIDFKKKIVWCKGSAGHHKMYMHTFKTQHLWYYF